MSRLPNRTRRRLLAATLGSSASLLLPSGAAFAQDGGTLAQVKARGSVRVGWAIYYPNVFRDPSTNQITGVMIDLMQAISEDTGIKVEWVEDNTATLIAGLQSNKFDLTLPMGKTTAREQAATFTEPLIQEGLSLLGSKRRIGDLRGWQAFNQPGKKISVTLGSNSDLIVTQLFDKAEILRVRSEADSIAQVLSERADVKAIGRSGLGPILSQRPELAEVPDSTFRQSPLAPTVRKGDLAFKEWFDQAGARVRDSGRLAQILARYGLDDSFIVRT